MLARSQSCLVFLAFFAAASFPVRAQINGVPASVTSYGFGGSTNPNPGVRASVTSLGPNGYGNRPVFGSCCTNFFLPASPGFPFFPSRRHRREDVDRDRSFFSLIGEPVYIPYAVPYVVDFGPDDEPDSTYADYPNAPSRRSFAASARRPKTRDSAPEIDESAKPTPAVPAEPVAPQPATILVFKDGHQSGVVNYAIVGDTLFDFGSGRTHKILLADLDLPATRKINDDQGVDFRVPTSVNH